MRAEDAAFGNAGCRAIRLNHHITIPDAMNKLLRYGSNFSKLPRVEEPAP
jgi:hypothetical protein